ncbi:MAG: twin-arginine translocation signal domain-containing protein, partial [Planctomycetota bacterium]
MKQPVDNRVDRRRFLKRAAAAGATVATAPYLITSTALGNAEKPPASDRIPVGFIGVGGHGIGHNLQMFLGQADAEPVALCDVDSRQIANALEVVRQKR